MEIVKDVEGFFAQHANALHTVGNVLEGVLNLLPMDPLNKAVIAASIASVHEIAGILENGAGFNLPTAAEIALACKPLIADAVQLALKSAPQAVGEAVTGAAAIAEVVAGAVQDGSNTAGNGEATSAAQAALLAG